MALDVLIQIHETNERLAEIHDLKGDLPDLLNQQENQFSDMNDEQKNNTSKIEEISKELTSCQSTLTDYNSKLDKYNNQLLKVTNNKEYDAVLLEIDHLKTQISDINTQISSFNNELESLQSSIDSNVLLIDELSEKIKVNRDELNIMMANTDKEEQLLIKNKEKLIKGIKDSSDFIHYNKLYEKYGQGMASTLRDSCNHCYIQLPPQLVVEIQYDKKVITCPSCSVFLYHKNDND